MQHPYEALKQQNAALLAGAHILQAVRQSALGVAHRLLQSRRRYEDIEHLTTVRIVPVHAVHHDLG